MIGLGLLIMVRVTVRVTVRVLYLSIYLCVTLTLSILTITQRHGVVVTTTLVASAVCG